MKKIAPRAEVARMKRMVAKLQDDMEAARSASRKEERKLALLTVTLVVSHGLCPVFDDEGNVTVFNRHELLYGSEPKRKRSKAANSQHALAA